MMGEFHFLRPLWLLAVLPAALLWWRLRRSEDFSRPWRRIIAPHLLPFLLRGNVKRPRFGPAELAGVAWLVAAISVSGPAWRREPAPFADDTAPLAIVIKVTPSMMVEDVHPGRLAAAVEKIRDLLMQRRGGKASLIAYAGTAHIAVPATTDAGIIDSFAQSLEPKIMPLDGDAAADALGLADRSLSDSGAGSILWITDSVSPEQMKRIAAWRKSSRTPVQLFPPLPEGAELRALSRASEPADARLVRLSADDSDVRALARAAKSSDIAVAGSGDRWRESGYWLTPVLALLMLPFFRRGWVLPASTGR